MLKPNGVQLKDIQRHYFCGCLGAPATRRGLGNAMTDSKL
jgi:hypothetical protein